MMSAKEMFEKLGYNRNLEDKLGRIGGYHYGNPKQ